jgi:hypothetical protein
MVRHAAAPDARLRRRPGGVVHPAPLAAGSVPWWRRRDLPSSRGIPLTTCPAATPRRSFDAHGLRAPRLTILIWPSVRRTTSASANTSDFGAIHTAYGLAVYASWPGLPRFHARLAYGDWPSRRAGFEPAGSRYEVSVLDCITSSSSELCSAQSPRAPHPALAIVSARPGAAPRRC